MTPEQFQQLVQVLTEHSGSGFNWVQGALALGATLVSVTGVVVGMRSAIAALSEQLKDTRATLALLSSEVHAMKEQLAVLKYAAG